MTLDPQARAAEAQRLLENPVLNEVFDEILAECIATWDATGFSGVADRERVWTLRKAVLRIRGGLEAMVTDGKIAARQLVHEPQR